MAAFHQRSGHLLECIQVYQGYCFGKQFLHLLQWNSLCTTWESLRKRLWVFSTPNSSWTVRILPWCHILCLSNKKKKQLWCFSFESNPETPADGWNVRDEVWLDKTSHYYDLLKGNTIVSVLEGLRRAGKYGQSKRCSIKLCSLPTAQFLSKSSDDCHQMWWGDVSPLSFYCFTFSCKKH